MIFTLKVTENPKGGFDLFLEAEGMHLFSAGWTLNRDWKQVRSVAQIMANRLQYVNLFGVPVCPENKCNGFGRIASRVRCHIPQCEHAWNTVAYNISTIACDDAPSDHQNLFG